MWTWRFFRHVVFHTFLHTGHDCIYTRYDPIITRFIYLHVFFHTILFMWYLYVIHLYSCHFLQHSVLFRSGLRSYWCLIYVIITQDLFIFTWCIFNIFNVYTIRLFLHFMFFIQWFNFHILYTWIVPFHMIHTIHFFSGGFQMIHLLLTCDFYTWFICHIWFFTLHISFFPTWFIYFLPNIFTWLFYIIHFSAWFHLHPLFF